VSNKDEDEHKEHTSVQLTNPPVVKSTTNTAASQRKHRGCYLEYVVQALTMLGTLLSIANLSLSFKVVTDGSISNMTPWAWEIFTMCTACYDVLIFSLMIMFSWRTFRTENILDNGQREAWPDKWYSTYSLATGTAAVVSSLTMARVLVYYYRYGNENPWLDSVYNVKSSEKAIQWIGLHDANIVMRAVLLLYIYGNAYRYLSEPTVVTSAKLQ
jgi:hypothetical protein